MRTAFVATALSLSSVASATDSYTLFESGQVRPLALSPSGSLLFAVNTPDSRLEIFALNEPQNIVEGRPFLYDARFTSSNGESACGSCHVFGDLDSLVWELGNPDDIVLSNPAPIVPNSPAFIPIFGPDPLLGQNPDFHP